MLYTWNVQLLSLKNRPVRKSVSGRTPTGEAVTARLETVPSPLKMRLTMSPAPGVVAKAEVTLYATGCGTMVRGFATVGGVGVVIVGGARSGTFMVVVVSSAGTATRATYARSQVRWPSGLL